MAGPLENLKDQVGDRTSWEKIYLLYVMADVENSLMAHNHFVNEWMTVTNNGFLSLKCLLYSYVCMYVKTCPYLVFFFYVFIYLCILCILFTSYFCIQ